jgi:hypothetical protein
MYAFGAILDEHPNYFDTEAIWSEFIGVVGETRLVEQILEMSDDDAVWLLGKLNRPDLTRRVRRQRPTLPRPRYERMDAIHRELTPADETYRSTSLVRVPRPGRRTPRQPGGSDTYRVNVEALAPDLRSEYQSRGVYRELEEQRP